MKTLYVSTIGSKLYGVSNENSDLDFKGIMFEDLDAILGLKVFEQKEFSNGIEDGPSKIEGCLFSLRRYLNLCLKGNPTVIEMAWADEKFHLYNTDIGKEIIEFVKKELIGKYLFKPYSAYHLSQMRKLQSMERVGKRATEVKSLGYDAKFSYHAYRLAKQCVGIMRDGILIPTLNGLDRDVALNIRKGIYSKEEILTLLQQVDTEMYDMYKISTIKDVPDYNKVNSFCIDIYSRFLNGEFDNQFKEFKPF